MRKILLTLGVCGLLLPLNADEAKDKSAVKEIDIKGVKLEPVNGRFTRPTEITSAEELAKTFTDKDVQEKLKKDVDLSKQKLLYFAWSGSGQDRVTPAVVGEGDKKAVIFAFTPGRTRDLRRHHRLYAIDRNIPYKLGR